MSLRFRNVDASPDDDVATWPYEALVTALDRGLVADWQPIFEGIRAQPWGRVARRVERIVADRPPDGVSALFTSAVREARERAEKSERAEVSSRVRAAIALSGCTNAELASLLGTSASRLSTYASGGVVPSAALLVRIERTADACAAMSSTS